MRCRSSHGIADDRSWVVVADPGDPRAGLFAQAVERYDVTTPVRLVDYRAVLAGGAWAERLPADIDVRIDSPGRAFDLYRAMLVRGAGAAEAEGGPHVSAKRAERLEEQRGRILYPRQWYLGFVDVMREVRAQMQQSGRRARFTSDVDDIALMFDKARCHEHLAEAGIPVARALPTIRGYNDLQAAISDARCRRVFVKLRHGSAASGVIAYETNGREEQAWSTAELSTQGGADVLHNSRRVIRYRDRGQIRRLIDALAVHGVHVEAWLPKLRIDGRAADLRIVMIGGEPAHTVLRLSRSPFTNLHLLNDRASADVLRERMGRDAWHAMLHTCRDVAARFPRTFMLGIDVAVTIGARRHAVLEVNAFGDLLYDTHWRGMTTHEAQVAAWAGKCRERVSAAPAELQPSGGDRA